MIDPAHLAIFCFALLFAIPPRWPTSFGDWRAAQMIDPKTCLLLAMLAVIIATIAMWILGDLIGD